MVGIKKIPDKSIDLVIIDPPYDIETTSSNSEQSRIGKDIKSIQKELMENNLTNGYDMSILNELVRVMKNINIYIWCNGRQVPQYIDYFVNNLKCKMEIIVWGKTNPIPLYNHKYLSDKDYCLYFRKKGYCNPTTYDDAKTIYISSINQKDKQKYGHPTIKPVELIRKLIRNSSNENDVVLDCFLGSGTTAVACILENRNYIGYEINKKFYNVAKKRILNVNKEDD